MAKSFLGTGWSFPPEFTGGSVLLTSDEEDIRRSLDILFSTKKGERVMVPDYGCDLHELLFEPLNTSFKTYLSEMIRTAILYYEARIDLENVTIDDSQGAGGMGVVYINLDYKIRSTNSRYNYVYPYFLIESVDKTYDSLTIE